MSSPSSTKNSAKACVAAAEVLNKGQGRPYTSLIALNGSFYLPMKDLNPTAPNHFDTTSMIVHIDHILQELEKPNEKQVVALKSIGVHSKDVDTEEDNETHLSEVDLTNDIGAIFGGNGCGRH